jgi:hypothetical protein
MNRRALALFASAIAFVSSAVADDAKYTIDTVVNSFDKEQVQPTKVGYQYWFADKAFAEGKTLKLSVVKPHSATHDALGHARSAYT